MMLGRTPQNITAIRPMKDGVIADFTVTEKMLQYFITRCTRRASSARARGCWSACPAAPPRSSGAPSRSPPPGAGAREVYLIDEPMAAAIGAGLPVDEARGSMVLDIGGGTSEVAVISLNGIVYSNSVRIGGDTFDDAIISYVRRNYGTFIGEATAERIKHSHRLGLPGQRGAGDRGQGPQPGRGHAAQLHAEQQRDPGGPAGAADGHRRAVKQALEQTPPELGADVAERGIVLTGGGALLRDIDRLIAEETGCRWSSPRTR
jgi:rod shape-determining protein MreB